MARSPEWAEVALSVYELHGTAAINVLTSAAGVGGAYHVAVEVYGLEWSFGGADLGTGVYMVHVGQSTLGNFLERVPLGRTSKTPEQVFAILDEFRRTWRGSQYHLLARNCANFSVEFSKRLGVSIPPDAQWVNKLAEVGKGMFGAEADATRRSITANENMDAFDDDELEDFAEDGDHIAMLELVWRRAKEYTLEWVEQQQHDAKFQDLLVEMRFVVPPDDNGSLRSTAVGLLRDERLKPAIAESTASALGLGWSALQGAVPCPVKITKFSVLSNLRVSTACRVTGGSNLEILGKMQDPRLFADKFKKAMKSAATWQRQQQQIIETMTIDTAPGQPALHERVLTRSKTQCGAIRFPRKEFATPTTSVNNMLGKLQELRFAVQEQSATQRTLRVMMAPEPCTPWWAG